MRPRPFTSNPTAGLAGGYGSRPPAVSRGDNCAGMRPAAHGRQACRTNREMTGPEHASGPTLNLGADSGGQQLADRLNQTGHLVGNLAGVAFRRGEHREA